MPAAAEALSPQRDTQQMPAGAAGCARLFLGERLGATRTHGRGSGGGATAGSESAEGIGGGAGSAARVRLGSVRARWPASGRRYWGGRIGGAGAMETPCQSLAGSANQDCDRSAPAISAPPRSRQRPQFSGRFSILQNLEEEKTGESRSVSLPPPALFLSLPPQPCPSAVPPTRGSDATEIHFGARRCLGQEASRGQRGLGQIEILQENSPSLVVTKHKTLREGTNGEGGEVDHLSSCQHPFLHALPAAKAAE